MVGFSAIFAKEVNFSNYLFAYLNISPISKGTKFFRLRADLVKGSQKFSDRVASTLNVSIPLKFYHEQVHSQSAD